MQRQNNDVMMTLILGVTLGAVLATVTFIVICIVWLVCRRRHSQTAQTTARDGCTRPSPETTENRQNESSLLPKTNNVTSPSSRYIKDGTLILTVTNNCTGNGSDITMYADRASGTKKGNAAACKSSSKLGISTVSNDVSRFGRTTTGDVNVWPCRSTDDCEESALYDARCSEKYHEDRKRLRRGSCEAVCDDAGKYLRKCPHKDQSSTEDNKSRSSRSCRQSR